MAFIHERREFSSWLQALKADALTAEQLAVLQTMLDDGEADTLERAAQLLDWQESVIDNDEHMYGF
ncbi:MAG: hypothetical protein R2867_08640 [Caldilineaceae bacterium]|nr:hypothetical protein [Caldilineaceae bacterium]